MTPHPFLDRNRRLRHGWWVAIFFAVLAALLLPLLLSSRAAETDVPIWQQALVVLGASAICQGLRRRPLREVTGALDARWLKEWLLGCALGATLMGIPGIVLGALGLVSWEWSGSGFAAVEAAFLLSLAVAAVEELLFRGFLFQRLRDGLGPWPGQIVAAAFFVLTHADALEAAGALRYLGGLNIFIASLMFGVAFVRTGSLALPIGLHFAANFVQGGVLGFGISGGAESGLLAPRLAVGMDWITGGAFGLEASVPGLVCVAAVTIFLHRWRR